MSLLPETASYQEHLEAAWRDITGRAFSPLDIQLASNLQRSGLPIETAIEVLRGAHQEFQRDARPGEPKGQTLTAYANKFREAWNRWRKRNVGAHAQVPPSTQAPALRVPDPSAPRIPFIGPGGACGCGVATVDQAGRCFGCGGPRS